jgi:IclR family transcriptional regulator, KDG regulon repressor
MPTLIPAASRALAVFEVFAREKRELSNSDMARLLSVADSSCSDLMHTLHSLGYLMRTSRTRRFYPTGRLHDVARQIAENDPLTAVGREAVELLAERANESASFGILDTTAVKVVAGQASKHPLRYIFDVGERIALHASALGKALLALLPPEEARTALQRRPLRQVTPQTITNIDQILAQLEHGRERGWFETRGEGTEGVTAFAVSGRLGGKPVSMSLVGPTDRMDRNRKAYLQILQEVRRTMLADD